MVFVLKALIVQPEVLHPLCVKLDPTSIALEMMLTQIVSLAQQAPIVLVQETRFPTAPVRRGTTALKVKTPPPPLPTSAPRATTALKGALWNCVVLQDRTKMKLGNGTVNHAHLVISVTTSTTRLYYTTTQPAQLVSFVQKTLLAPTSILAPWGRTTI